MPPIIYGDGKHTRDFISVDDVADAILISIRTMEQSKNSYNDRLMVPNCFQCWNRYTYKYQRTCEKND